jgi:hypothetical protein
VSIAYDPPMDASRRRTFALLNASTAPWWLAMIVAPRSRPTARLVDAAPLVLTGLGVSYATLLVRSSGDGDGVDVTDPDSVIAALSRPDGFLAGWAHYLAFDLFVGRWIWRTALDEGRGCRVALLLTWFLGPLGLTVFTLQRRLRPR